MFIVRRSRMAHRFNPLHVMCYLVRLGISLKKARKVCGCYEIVYCPIDYICNSFYNLYIRLV